MNSLAAGLPNQDKRSSAEIYLYIRALFLTYLGDMLKKFLPFLPILLLAGCSTTGQFTRLTPNAQPRNVNNLYPVEVAFDSKQQALRWESIKPFVIVNGEPLPLRPVPMVENRWEGLVPVPPGQNTVNYKFKFDYLYNAFDKAPQPNSESSRTYTLTVVDQ